MAEKHNRAAEDVVEYSVFPEIQSDKNGHELNILLDELATSYLTYLSPLLIDVIWQNEEFNLTQVSGKGFLDEGQLSCDLTQVRCTPSSETVKTALRALCGTVAIPNDSHQMLTNIKHSTPT